MCIRDSRGATRRLGVEATGRLRLLSWLGAEAEASATRARFVDGGRVPLAPAFVLAAGLTARHPSGVAGQLRLRHIGDRPATEDGALTAAGYTVLDAVATYRLGDWEAELALDNLTNADWREAQFAFASRLPSETMPIGDIHFTPGVPFSARAQLSYFF